MKRSNAPPGPRPVLPWRIPLALENDPLNFLTAAARKYGDFVRFRVRRKSVYLLSHPDYVHIILLTDAAKFIKGIAMQRAKRLLGEGLLTSEGEFHRRQRRLMQPAFHHQTIMNSYTKAMVECGASHSNAWSDGACVEMFEEMRKLSLAVVAKAMFGAEIETDAARISRAFTSAVNTLKPLAPGGRTVRSVLQQAVGRKKTFPKVRVELDSIIHRIMEKRRDHAADRRDVISMLMSAVDEESGDKAMTDTQLRDEVMTLIQAGHETTANALAWSWYLLARNPEAESRFHQELDDVLQGCLPTADDIKNLRYTGWLFMETLRLFPPGWVIGRRPIRDYELKGHVIPAGSLILICPYVMHHDRRFFEDPEKFKPERWAPEARRGTVPLSYLPFGHGPRRCIGDGFAMTEGVLLLATLGSRWRVRQKTNETVNMLPLVTLRPDRMTMVLDRRS